VSWPPRRAFSMQYQPSESVDIEYGNSDDDRTIQKEYNADDTKTGTENSPPRELLLESCDTVQVSCEP